MENSINNAQTAEREGKRVRPRAAKGPRTSHKLSSEFSEELKKAEDALTSDEANGVFISLPEELSCEVRSRPGAAKGARTAHTISAEFEERIELEASSQEKEASDIFSGELSGPEAEVKSSPRTTLSAKKKHPGDSRSRPRAARGSRTAHKLSAEFETDASTPAKEDSCIHLGELYGLDSEDESSIRTTLSAKKKPPEDSRSRSRAARGSRTAYKLSAVFETDASTPAKEDSSIYLGELYGLDSEDESSISTTLSAKKKHPNDSRSRSRAARGSRTAHKLSAEFETDASTPAKEDSSIHLGELYGLDSEDESSIRTTLSAKKKHPNDSRSRSRAARGSRTAHKLSAEFETDASTPAKEDSSIHLGELYGLDSDDDGSIKTTLSSKKHPKDSRPRAARGSRTAHKISAEFETDASTPAKEDSSIYLGELYGLDSEDESSIRTTLSAKKKPPEDSRSRSRAARGSRTAHKLSAEFETDASTPSKEDSSIYLGEIYGLDSEDESSIRTTLSAKRHPKDSRSRPRAARGSRTAHKLSAEFETDASTPAKEDSSIYLGELYGLDSEDESSIGTTLSAKKKHPENSRSRSRAARGLRTAHNISAEFETDASTPAKEDSSIHLGELYGLDSDDESSIRTTLSAKRHPKDSRPRAARGSRTAHKISAEFETGASTPAKEDSSIHLGELYRLDSEDESSIRTTLSAKKKHPKDSRPRAARGSRTAHNISAEFETDASTPAKEDSSIYLGELYGLDSDNESSIRTTLSAKKKHPGDSRSRPRAARGSRTAHKLSAEFETDASTPAKEDSSIYLGELYGLDSEDESSIRTSPSAKKHPKDSRPRAARGSRTAHKISAEFEKDASPRAKEDSGINFGELRGLETDFESSPRETSTTREEHNKVSRPRPRAAKGPRTAHKISREFESLDIQQVNGHQNQPSPVNEPVIVEAQEAERVTRTRVQRIQIAQDRFMGEVGEFGAEERERIWVAQKKTFKNTMQPKSRSTSVTTRATRSTSTPACQYSFTLPGCVPDPPPPLPRLIPSITIISEEGVKQIRFG
ncbi:hypothetical protein LOTGIDRAFT_164939 [Lottia gigantea]|uniref:Uncharacterized protein n=1 Tax=Lottia gigantea TaxID=225164 RepID=V4BLM4_LOTGI|nr:hypothetical protein LOTGIDRAFT_164939 [Lottia gigantea]ESO89634.1 hypothetical protein LOTGIDRAFT_164939 [Lottia gigantea]